MTPQVVCTRIISGRDKCPWVIEKEATAAASLSLLQRRDDILIADACAGNIFEAK